MLVPIRHGFIVVRFARRNAGPPRPLRYTAFVLPTALLLALVAIPAVAQEPRAGEVCEHSPAHGPCWRLEARAGRVVSTPTLDGKPTGTSLDLGPWTHLPALVTQRFPSVVIPIACGARAVLSYDLPARYRATAPGVDLWLEFHDCAQRLVQAITRGHRAADFRKLTLATATGPAEAILIDFRGDSAIASQTEVWRIGPTGNPQLLLARHARFASADLAPNGTTRTLRLTHFTPGPAAADDRWRPLRLSWNSRTHTFEEEP